VGIPSQISHQGVLVGTPAPAGCPSPSFGDYVNTSFQGSYEGRVLGAPTIVNATELIPYVLNLDTITKVRAMVLKKRSGVLLLLATSPNGGVDQKIPVGDVLIIHNPFPGDELTALKLVGTADIEYALFGNVS
jgi:hypothetical protein